MSDGGVTSDSQSINLPLDDFQPLQTQRQEKDRENDTLSRCTGVTAKVQLVSQPLLHLSTDLEC